MVRKHSHSKKHSAPKHHHAKRAHSASMSAMSPVFAPVSAPMRSGSAGEGRIFWALFTMVAIALIVVIILRLLAKDSTTTSIPRVAATTKAAFEEVKKNTGLIAGLSTTAVFVIILGLVGLYFAKKQGMLRNIEDTFTGERKKEYDILKKKLETAKRLKSTPLLREISDEMRDVRDQARSEQSERGIADRK